MSETYFTVDGFDNIIKMWKDMPEDGYRKPVIAAFKKAALPVKRAMIAGLPSSIKATKAAIKIKPGRGKSMTLAVGAFGRTGMYRNSRGVTWDPYQIIYWQNYGTLSNRAPEHQFLHARRKPSLNWRGGIRAGLFMEKAWNSTERDAEKIFETEYEKEYIKYLEARAKK